MDSSLSRVLELSGEAALLVKRGRVSYANAAARRMLGEDCVGKRPEALLGQPVAEAQSGSFVAGLPLGANGCILRSTKIEGEQLFFLSQPEPAPALLNEPFLFQLRSELMNLSLSTDLLRQWAESAGDERPLSSARSLARSYSRLKRLTANAALVLSHCKGQLSARRVPCDLSDLFDNLLHTVTELDPGIPLRWDLGKRICALASPEQLRQLLLNLLSNAMVHGKGLSRISVSLTETGGSIVLSVDDDGCGIPADGMHSVFERYRFPYATSEMSGGAGLGLSVCRLITAQHGGVLLLESREGKGTAVRACLGRSIPSDELLRSAVEDAGERIMQEVLLGLADCLPEACFTERFAD